MTNVKLRRGFGGLLGCLLTITGYVVVALNAPWFVTVIAILLSLQFSVETEAQR